jgi:hypothetical protein
LVREGEMMDEGWIGVDFDGTLVEYHDWQGEGVYGAPIPAMVERVRGWVAAGIQVRIFTARAYSQIDLNGIVAWCLEHLGYALPVTARKDYQMIELWDDRAVQVIPNTGIPLASRVAELEAEQGRLNLLLAGILRNRYELLAPHHAGAIKEHLGYPTDEKLDAMIISGKVVPE